jgi:hypothetical protein
MPIRITARRMIVGTTMTLGLKTVFQGLNSEPTFHSLCYKILILSFNHLLCSHFSFLAKVVSLKVVHPLKIYQNTTFHCPSLNGASFSSTSNV